LCVFPHSGIPDHTRGSQKVVIATDRQKAANAAKASDECYPHQNAP
jgi:hypothetical protein